MNRVSSRLLEGQTMQGRSPAVMALLTLSGLILLGPASAFAQQESATITGEVRDASGAVVPNAAVTVTNIDTNISIATVTNARGSDPVPNPPRAGHPQARERQLQGRAQRQRQSDVQQRLSARRGRQHLLLEFVSR